MNAENTSVELSTSSSNFPAMHRPIAILGAPSAIGLRLYDDGGVRRLDLAPDALRQRGLVTRLGAEDLGNVLPPNRYQDRERPVGRPRNEGDVETFSRALAASISSASKAGRFVLLLGGDCSIVLGALLGLRDAGRDSVGLVYMDAHDDFASVDDSGSGSACSMALSLAVGRCDTRLAQLGGTRPLVDAANVVHIGRRCLTGTWASGALDASAMLNLPDAAVRERGPLAVAREALERVASIEGGFWVHLDVDLLDPAVMPAVDTPEPNGLGVDEVTALVAMVARHPRALGLQLTLYDPTQDPDQKGAECLVSILENSLGGSV